jgi:hypothetical protein
LRKGKPDPIPEEIAGLHRYLAERRQAYVLCSEPFYARLKLLAADEWSSIFKRASESVKSNAANPVTV